MRSPVSTSHIFIVLSLEPEIMRFPQGETQTAMTSAKCPFKLLRAVDRLMFGVGDWIGWMGERETVLAPRRVDKLMFCVQGPAGLWKNKEGCVMGGGKCRAGVDIHMEWASLGKRGAGWRRLQCPSFVPFVAAKESCHGKNQVE